MGEARAQPLVDAGRRGRSCAGAPRESRDRRRRRTSPRARARAGATGSRRASSPRVESPRSSFSPDLAKTKPKSPAAACASPSWRAAVETRGCRDARGRSSRAAERDRPRTSSDRVAVANFARLAPRGSGFARGPCDKATAPRLSTEEIRPAFGTRWFRVNSEVARTANGADRWGTGRQRPSGANSCVVVVTAHPPPESSRRDRGTPDLARRVERGIQNK